MPTPSPEASNPGDPSAPPQSSDAGPPDQAEGKAFPLKSAAYMGSSRFWVGVLLAAFALFVMTNHEAYVEIKRHLAAWKIPVLWAIAIVMVPLVLASILLKNEEKEAVWADLRKAVESFFDSDEAASVSPVTGSSSPERPATAAGRVRSLVRRPCGRRVCPASVRTRRQRASG